MPHIRLPRLAARALLLACLVTGGAPVEAAGPTLRLQGLFCNTEEQIDRTLARLRRGVDPTLAAELENRGAVVCTHADRIHYLVRHPVAVGGSFAPMVKYEATLVGVAVGGAVRPVAPPVRIFFVTPEPVVLGAVERRI